MAKARRKTSSKANPSGRSGSPSLQAEPRTIPPPLPPPSSEDIVANNPIPEELPQEEKEIDYSQLVTETPATLAPIAGEAKGHMEASQPNVMTLPKPTSPSASGSRCIYFRDASQLDRLDALKAIYPRATSASIIQQLVTAFLDSLDANPTSRAIRIDSTIYL